MTTLKTYPELNDLVYTIVGKTIREINKVTIPVKSEMPYKAQWVLEEVIKDLQKYV